MSKKRIPWNKGKGKGWVDKRGYRWIYVEQDGKRRAKREHRHIMEQYLGRKLDPWEIIHHKDNNPANNNVENLSLTTYDQHTIGHHVGKHRPEATKKAMAVFAQMREEIHHLRRVKDTLGEQKTDLLEACKKYVDLIGRASKSDRTQKEIGQIGRELDVIMAEAIAKATKTKI